MRGEEEEEEKIRRTLAAACEEGERDEGGEERWWKKKKERPKLEGWHFVPQHRKTDRVVTAKKPTCYESRPGSAVCYTDRNLRLRMRFHKSKNCGIPHQLQYI
ncbi:unnamed protein product [Prunus armeniaca]